MTTYLVRRTLLFIPTLLGATLLVFFVVALAPGGITAFALNQQGEMRPAERKIREEYLNRRYGLNKPLIAQYGRWLNKVSPIGFRTWAETDPSVRQGAAQVGDLRWTRPSVKVPDLGDSFTKARPVSALIGDSLPITLLLQALSIPITFLIAVLTGIWAGKHRGKAIDAMSGTVSLALWSVPVIWAAVLLIGFLADQRYQRWFPANGLTEVTAESQPFLPTGTPKLNVTQPGFLKWRYVLAGAAVTVAALIVRARSVGNDALRAASLAVAIAVPAMLVVAFVWGAIKYDNVLPRTRVDWPASGWMMDTAWHLVLPLICLSYGSIAFLHKLTRASLLDTIQADFVRTARAKGLSEKVVLYAHAFRNSLLPLITVAASLLPALITGSIVVETVFGINGMGRLAYEAVIFRDRELFLSITLVTLFLTLLAYLVADILYVIADPRVSFE